MEHHTGYICFIMYNRYEEKDTTTTKPYVNYICMSVWLFCGSKHVTLYIEQMMMLK